MSEGCRAAIRGDLLGGDDRILMFAQDVLHLGRGFRKPPRGFGAVLAKCADHVLGRVPGTLGTLAGLVKIRVRVIGTEPPGPVS